ncbi:hypothetical protein FQA39_LY07915 [Lamprigera yunnana]|nr:hypothetical protein FQA39_LY07915 [Lamprigera yunnana]
MDRTSCVPKWFYQYLATAAGALHTFTCGMIFGWSSPSLMKLKQTDSSVQLTGDESSWIVVAISFGSVCGAVMSSVLLNKLSKRVVALLTTIPFIVSWFLIAFADSFEMLLTARIISGVPDGLVYCLVPLFIAEVSNSKIRGFLISCVMIATCFGYLIMNILGSYLSVKAASLTSSVFSLLAFVLFFFTPESPYYLIKNGNYEKAKQSLRLFQGTDDIESDFNRIRKAVEDDKNAKTGNYLDLFVIRSNLKALFIVIGLRSIQQLSGIMAVNFYAQTIFEEINSSISASGCSSIYFSVQIISMGVSSFFVDRLGRKPLIMISTLFVSVTMMTLAIVFYLNEDNRIERNLFIILSIVALLVFIMAFNIGLQSASMILVGEIFPLNVKSCAISINEISFCALIIIVNKFFYLTKDKFGMHVPFFAFSVCSMLGLCFVKFFVPETKKKTLEEIQDIFKGTKRKEQATELKPIKGKLDV